MQLQRSSASLGDNYETYHAFLADAAARFGGPPQPEQFKDLDGYLDACVIAQDIVRAEAILRVCRDYRRSGAPLDAGADPAFPLYDEQYRLLSAP